MRITQKAGWCFKLETKQVNVISLLVACERKELLRLLETLNECDELPKDAVITTSSVL